MSTHNICFHGEIRKIFTGYPPLSRPVFHLLAHFHFICWDIFTPMQPTQDHNGGINLYYILCM